jgi:ubiquinone/menaquinone biosynthesis C-methylase UbiE
MADRIFSDPALAALYDPMTPRERRADFDFYLPLVMAARAVLDVGCGTGAMLDEARKAGHQGRLCGLDPAEGMIAQARKRPDIEWIQGDLVSAKFDRAFDLVVMTGHAFQVLIEDAELRRALSAVRAALTEGGRFAFETRNPLAKAWEAWTPDMQFKFRDESGTKIRIARQVTAAYDERTVSFMHTFTSDAWAEPQISRSTLRFLDAASLTAFLNEAGFSIEEQYGDWDRSAPTNASPEIIMIASAAAPQ